MVFRLAVLITSIATTVMRIPASVNRTSYTKNNCTSAFQPTSTTLAINRQHTNVQVEKATTMSLRKDPSIGIRNQHRRLRRSARTHRMVIDQCQFQNSIMDTDTANIDSKAASIISTNCNIRPCIIVQPVTHRIIPTMAPSMDKYQAVRAGTTTITTKPCTVRRLDPSSTRTIRGHLDAICIEARRIRYRLLFPPCMDLTKLDPRNTTTVSADFRSRFHFLPRKRWLIKAPMDRMVSVNSIVEWWSMLTAFVEDGSMAPTFRWASASENMRNALAVWRCRELVLISGPCMTM